MSWIFLKIPPGISWKYPGNLLRQPGGPIIAACWLDVNVCSVVFWLGDLNYRISDIDSEVCKQMITKGQIEQLLKNNDQVRCNAVHCCLLL